MSGETYSLVQPDGSAYNLNQTARPGNDWGAAFDLSPAVGTMAGAFFVEGTGQELPIVLDLVIDLTTEGEDAMSVLVAAITGRARDAVALRRTGGTAGSVPDVPLLGLQSYGLQAVDPGDSGRQQLTLRLMRAAPGQQTTGTDGTGGVPGNTQPVSERDTITVMVEGVPTQVEVWRVQ